MNKRPDGTKSARVIQVIETKAKRGLGTEKDPVREVTQYWDLDGTFLAELDTELLLTQINEELNAIKDSISDSQMNSVKFLPDTQITHNRCK